MKGLLSRFDGLCREDPQANPYEHTHIHTHVHTHAHAHAHTHTHAHIYTTYPTIHSTEYSGFLSNAYVQNGNTGSAKETVTWCSIQNSYGLAACCTVHTIKSRNAD